MDNQLCHIISINKIIYFQIIYCKFSASLMIKLDSVFLGMTIPLNTSFSMIGVLKYFTLKNILDIIFDSLILIWAIFTVNNPTFKSVHVQSTLSHFLLQTNSGHTIVGMREVSCDKIKDCSFPKVLQLLILLEAWHIKFELTTISIFWIFPLRFDTSLEHIECNYLIFSNVVWVSKVI